MGRLSEHDMWPDELRCLSIDIDAGGDTGRVYADDREVATVAAAEHFDGWQITIYDGAGGPPVGYATLIQPGQIAATLDGAICTWAAYMTLRAFNDQAAGAD